MKTNSKISRVVFGCVAFGVASIGLIAPASAYTMTKGSTFSFTASSKNRCFTLANRGGNYVITNNQTQQVMWSSGTRGSKNVMRFEPNGNLVVYAPGPKPTASWQSDTRKKGGVKVTLQNDGNFVMYDAKNVAIWNTGKFDENYWDHKC
jgi:P pilus assembly chaperone PapD